MLFFFIFSRFSFSFRLFLASIFEFLVVDLSLGRISSIIYPFSNEIWNVQSSVNKLSRCLNSDKKCVCISVQTDHINLEVHFSEIFFRFVNIERLFFRLCVLSRFSLYFFSAFFFLEYSRLRQRLYAKRIYFLSKNRERGEKWGKKSCESQVEWDGVNHNRFVCRRKEVTGVEIQGVKVVRVKVK